MTKDGAKAIFFRVPCSCLHWTPGKFWLAALHRNIGVAEFLPKKLRRDQGWVNPLQLVTSHNWHGIIRIPVVGDCSCGGYHYVFIFEILRDNGQK